MHLKMEESNSRTGLDVPGPDVWPVVSGQGCERGTAARQFVAAALGGETIHQAQGE